MNYDFAYIIHGTTGDWCIKLNNNMLSSKFVRVVHGKNNIAYESDSYYVVTSI